MLACVQQYCRTAGLVLACVQQYCRMAGVVLASVQQYCRMAGLVMVCVQQYCICLMGAVAQGVSSFPKYFVFASLCSFICLQAVYQLSGPED